MTDEPSHATRAEALTVVGKTVVMSDPRSRATIVVTILVMLAGATRAKASCA
jgi:hypothetical protein